MHALPVTTRCYSSRVAVLQALLLDILTHSHDPECTSELAACFDHEARCLQASIWAMHAEVEQD